MLRGYFLLVILIDHLAHFPGLFELVTGKGWLWSSAAEGFFIISGIMVGLIRGKELTRKPFAAIRNKLWQRSGQLYLWSIGLTLAFTAVGLLFAGHADLKPGLATDSSLTTIIWQTLTFQYFYGWADFLSHYAICMALAPFALYALHRGWWRQLVIASLLVWWFRGNNFAAAWQLLFVGGIIGGYYLKLLELWLARWSSTSRRQLTNWWLGATAATMTVSVMVVHIRPWLLDRSGANEAVNSAAWNLQYVGNVTGSWFDKLSLAPGRILMAALWFGALYILFRRYESQLNTALGWLLVPLGRNSLFVYIVHSVIVFIVPLFLPTTTNIWINIVLNTLAILLIWRITLLYSREQRTKRERKLKRDSSSGASFRAGSASARPYFHVES